MAKRNVQINLEGDEAVQEITDVSHILPNVRVQFGRFFIRTKPNAIRKILEKGDETLQLNLVAALMRFVNVGTNEVTGDEYLKALNGILQLLKTRIFPYLAAIESTTTDMVIKDTGPEPEEELEEEDEAEIEYFEEE